MSLSLVAALCWCVAANLIAMLPMRDHHWRAAHVLMVLGLPIVPGLAVQDGWPHVLAFLLAAGSILRWPVFLACKRLRVVLSR